MYQHENRAVRPASDPSEERRYEEKEQGEAVRKRRIGYEKDYGRMSGSSNGFVHAGRL
jgi:hypothetical protein